MLSSRHRPRCRFRRRCTRYRQRAVTTRARLIERPDSDDTRAGTYVPNDGIGERNQAKRTGTWRRMNILRFSLSKTLNSVIISQM